MNITTSNFYERDKNSPTRRQNSNVQDYKIRFIDQVTYKIHNNIMHARRMLLVTGKHINKHD